MKPQAGDTRDPESVVDIASKRIVYAVSGMDRVQVRKNVVYKSTPDQDLLADIYLPPGLSDGESRPAVLFIHGGPLPPNMAVQPKEWGAFISYGQLAAVSGFVGFSFNHRYYGVGEKELEDSMSDVDDAIAYIRKHAASLHVDPQRICLWAFSGGGPHLVLALREPRDYIRCIVSYYALLDFCGASKDSSLPLLAPEAAKRFSPARCLNDKNGYVPPVLIARAGQDHPVINSSIDAFVSKALNYGVTLEFYNHPAGRHAFDILDDDARSREIIAHTIEFVKANLFNDRLKASRLAQSLSRAGRLLQKGEVAGARELAKSLRMDSANGRDLLDRVFSEAPLSVFGQYLLTKGKTKEAVAVFEWILEEHPYSPGACDNLGGGYEAEARIQDAVQITEKGLQLLENSHGIGESHASSIRVNLENRLKRLQTAGAEADGSQA